MCRTVARLSRVSIQSGQRAAHEAWNRSSEDRVVLIFESHHPDLTPVRMAADATVGFT
jgi:hypothetical protein